MRKIFQIFILIISITSYGNGIYREKGRLETISNKGILLETRFDIEEVLVLDLEGKIELKGSKEKIELLPDYTKVKRDGKGYIVRTFIGNSTLEKFLEDEIDIEKFNSGISFGIVYPFKGEEGNPYLEGYFNYKPEEEVSFEWENKNLNILTNLAPEEKFSSDNIKLLNIENIGKYTGLKKMMKIKIQDKAGRGDKVEFKGINQAATKVINPQNENGKDFGEINVSYQILEEGNDVVLYFSHSGKAPEEAGTYKHIEVIEITFQ